MNEAVVDLVGHESKCTEKQKRIVSKENKSSHTSVNKDHNNVRQYHIDGDVIKDQSIKKCDYLVLNDDKATAYYIELKGSKIQEAIEQVETTEKMIRSGLKGYQSYYRIVFSGSGTHNIIQSSVLKWQKKLGVMNKIQVAKVSRSPMEENI